jgi:ATPase complex subunit ATP10
MANRKNADHTPKALNRPLGMPNPPQPGENSGFDHRTWQEKRDDFFNYDKHLEKRKYL